MKSGLNEYYAIILANECPSGPDLNSNAVVVVVVVAIHTSSQMLIAAATNQAVRMPTPSSGSDGVRAASLAGREVS